MSKKEKVIWVSVFLLVLAGLIGGGMAIYQASRKKSELVLINPESGPVMVPKVDYLQTVAKANAGRLVAIAGEVKRIPWDTPDEMPATAGAVLYQGDAYKTGSEGKARVMIDEVGTVDILPNTEVIFGSLLPETISLRQNGGAVKATVTTKVSLRVNAALIELDKAEIVTGVENGMLRVDVLSGTSKVAYVDYTGRTKMWEVGTGKWLTVNDNTRRVKTTGKLVANVGD